MEFAYDKNHEMKLHHSGFEFQNRFVEELHTSFVKILDKNQGTLEYFINV